MKKGSFKPGIILIIAGAIVTVLALFLGSVLHLLFTALGRILLVAGMLALFAGENEN